MSAPKKDSAQFYLIFVHYLAKKKNTPYIFQTLEVRNMFEHEHEFLNFVSPSNNYKSNFFQEHFKMYPNINKCR